MDTPLAWVMLDLQNCPGAVFASRSMQRTLLSAPHRERRQIPDSQPTEVVLHPRDVVDALSSLTRRCMIQGVGEQVALLGAALDRFVLGLLSEATMEACVFEPT
jgi:hypothetical protein